MYTAIVLDDRSKSELIHTFGNLPSGWELICHHMTINLGSASKGPAESYLGQEVYLKVITMASDRKVYAVGVETEVPSVNPIKHITIAVNRSMGGSPKDANKLTNWEPVEQKFLLLGTVAEVGK